MNRIHKFWVLNSGDRFRLLQASLTLHLVRLGLLLLPFQTLLQMVERCNQGSQVPKTAIGEETAIDAAVASNLFTQTTWAIKIASRYTPGGAKCLAQALTTQILLGQCGYPTHLRLGVHYDPQGRLIAHAWVEHNGEVIVGAIPSLEQFKLLTAPSTSQGDIA
jgi:hypothetical protein